MIVSLTKHLMFQVLFFFIISCKILCKNPFNLFIFYNFTKIKSFECPKSKPATHCFIYQYNTWTIRRLAYEMIDPATQHIVLKIVQFLEPAVLNHSLHF